MKKWIAIFCLLLVTFGSLYPCCLQDDCTSESLVRSPDHSDDDEKDQGFCSPFSACAACAVSVEMEALQITVQKPVAALPQYNSYHVSAREGIYPALFQPPRSC